MSYAKGDCPVDRPVDDWSRPFSQTTVCAKRLTECCAITFLVRVEGRIGHDQPFRRASPNDGKDWVQSLSRRERTGTSGHFRPIAEVDSLGKPPYTAGRIQRHVLTPVKLVSTSMAHERGSAVSANPLGLQDHPSRPEDIKARPNCGESWRARTHFQRGRSLDGQPKRELRDPVGRAAEGAKHRRAREGRA